jgi:NADPH:quinone reductase-like Zn-dependent oxidoreductase
MAVQLAREVGARVIGTASPPNHADLLSLGAEPVTYGDGLLERIRVLAPDGVDAAIDTAGTDEAIETSVALVADRSRIVTIAAFAQGFRLGLKVLGGAPGADAGVEIRAAARGELVERIEGGTLTVRMDSVHRFSDAAAAHQRLASGLAHGKIVLVPDS